MNSGTRPLTDDEAEQMLNSFNNLRDSTLFLLGIKTGFRISELLSLKLADLKEHNGTLKLNLSVSKSKVKGKTSTRSIPLSNSTLEALKLYVDSLPEQQTYLFESREDLPLSRIQAWRIWKLAARRLNFTGRIATHSARKSFAYKMYEKLGKDIAKTQRAMGHKSVNSTIAYLQVNMDEINNAILTL